MKNVYESPLSSRYASPYMLNLFSSDTRYRTWRKLWTALAKEEMVLGLPISEAQVDALAQGIHRIEMVLVEGVDAVEHDKALQPRNGLKGDVLDLHVVGLDEDFRQLLGELFSARRVKFLLKVVGVASSTSSSLWKETGKVLASQLASGVKSMGTRFTRVA